MNKYIKWLASLIRERVVSNKEAKDFHKFRRKIDDKKRDLEK